MKLSRHMPMKLTQVEANHCFSGSKLSSGKGTFLMAHAYAIDEFPNALHHFLHLRPSASDANRNME